MRTPELTADRDYNRPGNVEDRGADGLGQVIADGEPDARVAAPVKQLVTGAGAVDPHQQLDRLDMLGWDLRERLLGDPDLISGGVRTRVAGAKLTGQRLPGLIAIGQQRVKPKAALARPRRALLLGIAG